MAIKVLSAPLGSRLNTFEGNRVLIRAGRSDLFKLKNNAPLGSAVMYFEPGEDRQGNSHEVACGVITVNDSSKPGGIRYDYYIGDKVIAQDV